MKSTTLSTYMSPESIFFNKFNFKAVIDAGINLDYETKGFLKNDNSDEQFIWVL